MHVAFYKGREGIFDKLICWWTKSEYSHCELYFSHETMTTFSADFDKFKTRFKTITHYDPDKWDLVKINLTAEEERRVFNFCRQETNCLYDIVGILFTQILPLSFENPWWWFCSEVCVAALQKARTDFLCGIVPHKESPKSLHKILSNLT